MEWIERQSSLTRWILVPLIFIGLIILIPIFLYIVSWILLGLGDPLFYETIIDNGITTFCASMFAGWTAPKFKILTTCICASIVLLLNFTLIFVIFYLQSSWELNDVWVILGTTGGVVIAIWYAKKKF